MSEADLTRYVWRKSSRSNTRPDQCVELAVVGHAVTVRDSKYPDGPKLTFSALRWKAFAARIKRDDPNQ